MISTLKKNKKGRDSLIDTAKTSFPQHGPVCVWLDGNGTFVLIIAMKSAMFTYMCICIIVSYTESCYEEAIVDGAFANK